MKIATPLATLFLAAATVVLPFAPPGAKAQDVTKKAPRPLRALYITGGCCHDYQNQKAIIPEGVSGRARVEWTIVHEGGTSSDHRVSVYSIPNWTEGYDVIVHNECFSAITDKDFIDKVVAPHRDGLAAVVIHCAMHTFRDLKTDEWRDFLGVTTRRHGPQQPLDVKNLQPDHPIMKGFPSVWTTGKEELYAIEKVWPGTVPLAQAYALDNKKDHAVIWAHEYGKGRVFGTTLAHNNATMQDPVYMEMLTRGLLWACGKLGDDGKPIPGYEAAEAKK